MKPYIPSDSKRVIYLIITLLFLFFNTGLKAQEEENELRTLLGQNQTQGVFKIEFADLDGDGDDDLVFATKLSISWMENTGNGSFSTPKLINNFETILHTFEIGDLDNDGDEDVIYQLVTFSRDTEIGMYLNNGAAEFTESERLFEKPRFRVFDINLFKQHVDSLNALFLSVPGDNYFDLLKLSIEEDVVIIDSLNQVTGYTGALLNYDINEDGYQDLLTYSTIQSVSDIKLLVTDGSDFMDIQLVEEKDSDTGIKSLIYSDIDNDEDMDIIVSTGSRLNSEVDTLNFIYLYKNMGNGDFSDRRLIASIPNLTNKRFNNLFRATRLSASIDLNNDGWEDIVLIDEKKGWKTGRLLWLENLKDTTFSEPKIIPQSRSNYNNVQIHDVDGDGINDLVASSILNGRIDWFRNTDEGNSILVKESISNPSISAPLDIVHFNTFGTRNDVFVATGSSDRSVLHFKNENEFEFSDPVVIDTSDFTAIELHHYDWDRDGREDLLSFTKTIREFSAIKREYSFKVNWYENLGDGTFNFPKIITQNESNNEAVFFGLGDIEGDGDKDIVLIYSPKFVEQPYLYIIENNFVGEPLNRNEFIYLPPFSFIELLDFDNDGVDELVTPTTEILPGRPTRFQPTLYVFNIDSLLDSEVIESEDASEVFMMENLDDLFSGINYAFGDLDNDENIDVVFGAYVDRKIQTGSPQKLTAIFRNSFNNYESVIIDSTGDSFTNVVFADINEDGFLDVIASIEQEVSIDVGNSQNIIWYKNLGNRSFIKQDFIARDIVNAGNIISSDINNDGIPELLSVQQLDGNVAIYDGNEIQLLTNNEIESPESPDRIELFQNYPNPFNPVTQINYSIPNSAHVELKVYNIVGQLVYTLVDRTQSAGEYNVQFEGDWLSSGVYIYQLRVGSGVQTRKMLLIK